MCGLLQGGTARNLYTPDHSGGDSKDDWHDMDGAGSGSGGGFSASTLPVKGSSKWLPAASAGAGEGMARHQASPEMQDMLRDASRGRSPITVSRCASPNPHLGEAYIHSLVQRTAAQAASTYRCALTAGDVQQAARMSPMLTAEAREVQEDLATFQRDHGQH